MGLFARFRKPPTPHAEVLDEKAFTPSNSTSDLGLDLRVPEDVSVDAIDVMVHKIFTSVLPYEWLDHPSVASADWSEEIITGVCVRSKYGMTRTYPSDHRGLDSLREGIMKLQTRAAIKMQNKAMEVTMKHFIHPRPDLSHLVIGPDLRIQILNDMESLEYARKNQFAAFIRSDNVLVVWADRVEDLVPGARLLDDALVQFLWVDEKDQYGDLVPTLNKTSPSKSLGSPRTDDGSSTTGEGAHETSSAFDTETGQVDTTKSAPVAFVSAVQNGLSLGLAVILVSLGLRSIVVRYFQDGDVSRFALAAVLPLLALVAAFPCSAIISSIFRIAGPIAHYNRNSTYFSAIPPARDAFRSVPLLPITVQMPVYKESLEDVIIPTLDSVKKAVTIFERQGGSVNIIVCEDGLQAVDDKERIRRIRFYQENSIAYVARPPHGQDGFERRGRFKKAGNLNHCNALSMRVESIMDELRGTDGQDPYWGEIEEKEVYDRALSTALEESAGTTLAGGNIRIGEIILLIDSDTRVPEDCFMDASLEMSQCPQVAIIQHVSGVMQVAHHFFENGMAFFTRILQIAISVMVAGGDVAPFVGHNAFLRWSALQECAQVDDYDGKKRIWSEVHVSEDFQVALRLQTNGWILRWATYSNDAFQEGVSLTCADEISRWQKYAWGCSEIIFNPLYRWPTRGPLSKLFRQFLWSPIPAHSKWTIMAYMFSYYALALAWSASILNFVLIGVFALEDTFYTTSWQTLFVCLIVFQGLNNLSTMVLYYRLKVRGTGKIALDLLKWIPFFTIMFSGMSFAISNALLSHIFSINMSWTATSKSVEKSNFFLQFPRIIKRFWVQILLSVVVLGAMIASTTSIIPLPYRVYDITAIIPLALVYGCHLIWAFVLDPYFTTFTF